MNCFDKHCDGHARQHEMVMSIRKGLRWQCPKCQTWWPIKKIEMWIIDVDKLEDKRNGEAT